MKTYRVQIYYSIWIVYWAFISSLWLVANHETFKDYYIINTFVYSVFISILAGAIVSLLLALKGFKVEQEKYCFQLYNLISQIYLLYYGFVLSFKELPRPLTPETFDSVQFANISNLYIQMKRSLSPILCETQAKKGVELSDNELPNAYILELLKNCFTIEDTFIQCEKRFGKTHDRKDGINLLDSCLSNVQDNLDSIDINMGKLTTYFKWSEWADQKNLILKYLQ